MGSDFRNTMRASGIEDRLEWNEFAHFGADAVAIATVVEFLLLSSLYSSCTL